MSQVSNIGGISHASDLVTVLRGTKYHNVYYFFTNSDLDKVETYRNNTGFRFYAPPSTDVEHFLYWQIDKEKISSDQTNVYGLSSNISAFLHNVDILNVNISPNLPSTLIGVEDLSVLSVGGKLIGKTEYDKDVIKNLELSAFRCAWLSDYVVQYSNTYPSVLLNLSSLHDGYRFDHWKVSSDINPYLFANSDFKLSDVFEVNSDTYIYPNYIKLVYIDSKIIGNGLIYGLRDSYDKNELIGLSAIPDEHYHFLKFNGSIVDPKNAYLSVMYAVLSSLNNTLSATFIKNIYQMIATTIGNDGEKIPVSVQLSVIDSDSTYSNTIISTDFEYGLNIQLNALPDSTGKYNFTNWSDGNLNKIRKMTITESCYLSAIYVKSGVLKLNIIVCPAGAGYVHLTNSNSLYYYGDSTILHAYETNEEYRFDHWSNGSTSTQQIITNILATTNLSAVFIDKMRISAGDGTTLETVIDGVTEDLVYLK